MYHDLWTNSPKEMTEYPDYTYKTHFGKAVPAFVPGPVLKGYIEGKCNIQISRNEKINRCKISVFAFSTIVNRSFGC